MEADRDQGSLVESSQPNISQLPVQGPQSQRRLGDPYRSLAEFEATRVMSEQSALTGQGYVAVIAQKQVELQSELRTARTDQQSIMNRMERLEQENKMLLTQLEDLSQQNKQLKLDKEQQKKSFERKIRKLEKRLEEMEGEKQRNEEARQKLERKIAKLTRELEEAESEMEDLRKQREDLQLQVQELGTANKQNEAKLADLDDRDRETTTVIEKIEKAVEEEKSRSKTMQTQLQSMVQQNLVLQMKMSGLEDASMYLAGKQTEVQGDIATLVIGQMACILEKQIFGYVLPQLFDSSKDHYTLNRMKRILKSAKPFKGGEEERKQANRRWKNLQDNIGWDEQHSELISDLKDMRKTRAHPEIMSISELRRFVMTSPTLDEVMRQDVQELVDMLEAVNRKLQDDGAVPLLAN